MRKYDYDRIAEIYEILELDGRSETVEMNDFLHSLFKCRDLSTVVDFTCGTGAQAVGLARRGYKVTASDLNSSMLQVARKKGRGLRIRFFENDIREARLGKFDAAISMYNAVGHLSESGFRKAIRNVSKNMNSGGLFIFDIFNLDFMANGGAREFEYLDIVHEQAGTHYVRISKNRFDVNKGIIRVNNKVYVQKGAKKPDIFHQKWDMKIYSRDQLSVLLRENGFSRFQFHAGPNKKFIRKTSSSILVVAQRNE